MKKVVLLSLALTSIMLTTTQAVPEAEPVASVSDADKLKFLAKNVKNALSNPNNEDMRTELSMALAGVKSAQNTQENTAPSVYEAEKDPSANLSPNISEMPDSQDKDLDPAAEVALDPTSDQKLPVAAEPAPVAPLVPVGEVVVSAPVKPNDNAAAKPAAVPAVPGSPVAPAIVPAS